MTMKDFVFALDRLNEYSHTCNWRTPIWDMIVTRKLEDYHYKKGIYEQKY